MKSANVSAPHVRLCCVLRTATASQYALAERPAPAVPDIPLLDALYGSTEVRQVLRRNHVPIVRATGSLWLRFPKPSPLTNDLVAELYLDCGLSSSQIELVTGQPSVMILRRLVQLDIPRRPRGGLSPFLRQHRATNNAST